MKKQTLATATILLCLFAFLYAIQFGPQIEPVQAVPIWTDQFESGLSVWSGYTGASITTSPVHHGSQAAKLSYNYDAHKIWEAISTSYTTVFSMALFRYESGSGASAFPALYSTDNNDNLIWYLAFNTTHLIFTRYYPSEVETTWTNSVVMDVWYNLEVEAIKANGTAGGYHVWVGNTERITDVGLDTSSIPNMATQGLGYPHAFGDTSIVDVDCATFDTTFITPEIGGGSSGGTVTQNEYIKINSTGTWELNSTFDVVSNDTDSVTVINTAIGHVSPLYGSVFVFNGTYQLSGTIEMQNNANLTLQDAVYFNHTSNNYIVEWDEKQNTTLWAYTNATIHGAGIDGYDLEKGFHFDNMVNATIGAENLDGLRLEHLSAQAMECHMDTNHWMNDSTLMNINVSGYALSTSYSLLGLQLDGLQNCQLINLTVDGLLGLQTRSLLVIGGEERPSNNVNITGGIYKNSYGDNGIYLGGWNVPVTNIRIENVTTANNNAIAQTAHSGLKFRPASNITVINWTSNGDFNGMELGSSTSVAVLLGSSMYNNISGTVNNPVNCGIILDMDYDDADFQVAYNWFNITVNNAGKQSVWIDDEFSTTTSVHNNTIYLVSIGASRQAVKIENNNCSYNTIYGTFINNGEDGYFDIEMTQTTTAVYNTFNIYSTTGNPNGLYNFVNGSGNNYVYYPYNYSGPPPVLVTVTINNPKNQSYSVSDGSTPATIDVSISVTVTGDTLNVTWWNCKNATTWIYASNQTYSGATTMTGMYIGEQYTFYAFANATDGTEEYATVMFSVTVAMLTTDYGNWWGGWW